MDVELLFPPAGRPIGTPILKAGLTFEPKFIGLNVNIGSPGGSLITATIRGVGKYVTGFKILLANNNELCESYNFIDFETL